MIGNILSAVMDTEYNLRFLHALTSDRRPERRKRPAGHASLFVLSGIIYLLITISSAILSDITTPANRAKALAHVGIAFAICFIIGPPIGAYFASRPVTALGSSLGLELNVYAAPAILTLVLLLAETAFLAIALPETRGKGPKAVPPTEKANGAASTNGTNGEAHKSSRAKTVEQRLSLLKALRRLHFLFLGLFSGVEFTLTFLTFDRKA
ncbi:hypothetical protein EWM64_g4037 [Hericium alpestre]|uniref:Major facilitator superfamily (MFS) profile domain-containing protein n=1 Tax=Hericium alpestre TaxID=135208 RepID=A0A4Z0A0J9_9AGAM|nr:hypothetical protein EWM64_g4037 [Hericium alpestre]